jgi:peptidyl-prolyl cis-trans isomerase SurA
MDQLEKTDFDVIKNMNVGEVSNPYESRDEKGRIVYKIIRLKERSDPHRANLRSDYSFLSDAALNDKMHKVIKEWVDEKIESSYIYIEESFKRCGLSNTNWLKQ